MQRKTKKSLSVILALAIVVGLFAAMPLTAYALDPAPNIQIDYVNETLTGFTPGSFYNIIADYSWGFTDTVGSDDFDLEEFMFGTTASINEGENTSTPTSEVQILVIPARPAAPAGLSTTDETAAGEKDGTLIGVTADMEYKIIGSSAWIPGTGATVAGLAPGDYQARYKAVAGTSFASEIAVITVGTADTTDYTFNTPAAVTVNGVTATFKSDIASPQRAGTTVELDIALSGTTVEEGYHTFGLSSVKAGFSYEVTWIYYASVDTGYDVSDGELEWFFTMPSEDVDDIILTHTFVQEDIIWFGIESLAANGADGSATTTQLTIVVSTLGRGTLSTDMITVTGATKGALTFVGDDGSGNETYTLDISDITVGNGGRVLVVVDRIYWDYVKNIKVWIAAPPSAGGGPATYTVTFNSNGGSAVASQSLAYNGKAAQPANPTRDGFVFAGWYTDAALSNAYDFNRNVTASITLYAKWTEVQGVMPELPVNPFTDVTGDDWFIDDLIYVVSIGLVKGKTLTSYAPDDSFTYAEAVTLAARMHQLYTTGEITLDNGEPVWYQSYIDYALENGIISSTDYDWDAPATRADYVGIFANALPDDALPLINDVADGSVPDVPMDHPQAAAIYKLYRAGILEGVDADHYFLPDTNILRCEIAVVAARMMNPEARVAFSI